MTRRMVVEGIGARVAIELLDGAFGADQDETTWAHLRDIWSCARVDEDVETASTLTARLSEDYEVPADVTGRDTDILANVLTQRVTQAVIGARAGELLLFHAGAVADLRTGRTLVTVAKGGTGKTTLTKTLGRRYGYLSDETVGITADGRVLPYRKPLSVRVPGKEVKVEASPEALGLLAPPRAPRVERIVLLNRVEDAPEPTIELVDMLDAIVALAPETSSLSKLPGGLHAIASHAAATGGIERWTYTEHETLLPHIESVLGGL